MRKGSKWLAQLRIGRKAGERLYDLENFSDASIQQWHAYGTAVRDFHYALFFDLDGQRAARHKDLRTALQAVPGITVSIDNWCRIVNFKFCLSALSPAGSLRWVGGRFNIGIDVDSDRFPSFPALYLAEDFETAFREYHGLKKSTQVEGLSPEELTLENAGSWATLKVAGQVKNVFDLTKKSNLTGVCKIFAKFNLSSRVRELEELAQRPRTTLVRTPTELQSAMMLDDWRAWPVHFDVPSNSQVFARMLLEAGFEGVMYRSTQGARKCLAIFPQQLVNSDSFIELHPDRPPTIDFARLDATNCLDIS